MYYGPVKCIDGKYKGRIGYYDDDIDEDDIECAVVYWGDMLLCMNSDLVPIECVTDKITMRDLAIRLEILYSEINKTNSKNERLELLEELVYTKTLFYERHIKSRFSTKNGLKIFISYSSLDRIYANTLYVDLAELGHDPWIDTWDIKVGQSIPEKIQKALSVADYIIVLLSPNLVESKWVQAEWQTMYWNEIENNKVKVIPVLLNDCEIPEFLKVKKYADFREDYSKGFDLLVQAFK